MIISNDEVDEIILNDDELLWAKILSSIAVIIICFTFKTAFIVRSSCGSAKVKYLLKLI